MRRPRNLESMNKPMTLNESLWDYTEVRQPRYSASTWKAHSGQLDRFRTYATRELGYPNVLLSDIDERLCVRYFNRLRSEQEPSTVNNYRQIIRQFFDYCKGEGWIARDPMRHVDPARVARRVRLQLSKAELREMLEGASPRDRIALALGMNTMLRGGDIAALKVGSANLTNDTLSCWIEKTDEETLLPITSNLRTELLRWLEHYAETMGHTIQSLPNTWTLVPPAHFQAHNVHRPELGGVVTYRVNGCYRHPEQIVQRALVRIGHPTQKEGFHTLRRSGARAVFDHAVAQGVGDPIRMPQAMLGHKNRATTEIYLGITHEKRQLDELLRGKSFLDDDADSASHTLTVQGTESVPRVNVPGRRVAGA